MKNATSRVVKGDCLVELGRLADESVDLVYLDPPFFTNRKHSGITRDREQVFSFSDLWDGLEEYAEFMAARLKQVLRVLRPTGSVFVHCDSSANFLLRWLLDGIFGKQQFRSEVIWSYKRWSNSAKGLLPAHQTILFYSKNQSFKFNRIYSDYSATTNVDQILQLRARDQHGVSRYALDENGEVVFGNNKRGVPLSDVWEIPFLNPKAKERTGYPTQKPVLLLERIIELVTQPGDLVVDPFCGSGTTLVAASLLNRTSLGIDCSSEAVKIARGRLKNPSKTDSALLKKGRDAYVTANVSALATLTGLDLIPVHRNAGIDGFIRADESLIPVWVQREGESLTHAAQKLRTAAISRRVPAAILIQTKDDDEEEQLDYEGCQIDVIPSTALVVKRCLAAPATAPRLSPARASNKKVLPSLRLRPLA